MSLWLNRCLVNVDAPLSDFTILEQRAVMTFLWTERIKPADMHRRISAQYGSANCMSKRKVDEWVETISPEEQVSDEGRSGRPSTSGAQPHNEHKY